VNDTNLAPNDGEPHKGEGPTSPIDQMDVYLKLQPEEVSGHVAVVCPKDVGMNIYRIDKNLPEKYIPNMPKSAMKAENSSAARVTVAPTLLGCLIGYFRAERDIVESGFTKPGKEEFHGGYHIAQMSPVLALKPDDTLVPDQQRSNEHWLVSFNEEHVEFVPEEVGKCFFSDITYLNLGPALPAITLTLWLEITKDDFDFCPTIRLKAGHYKIKLFWKNMHRRNVMMHEEEVLSVQEVDQAEFMKRKGLHADLLSYQEKPKHMAW
jgi:hypothetical protein